MSMRRKAYEYNPTPEEGKRLFDEQVRTFTEANSQFTGSEIVGAESCLNNLTETERNAAMLGVTGEDWKPISFMNVEHYAMLVKTNSLAGTLAKQLEAYKTIASEQTSEEM